MTFAGERYLYRVARVPLYRNSLSGTEPGRCIQGVCASSSFYGPPENLLYKMEYKGLNL